jgi:glycosyltransferase involved in cell wall biosynthesis
MQNPPRVSVVMPTYRRSQLVGRALQSILDQTFDDFEVIVVDDNSIDHPEQQATQKLITKQFNDPRIHYIINKNSQGGSEARNIGIREARGEYVAFLDDDEDWLPEKLSTQVAFLDAAESDVGVIDTGFFDWKKNGRVRIVHPKMQGWIKDRLLRKTGGRAPKLSTMLCRRKALIEVGAFDPDLKTREDLDLYIRLARHYRFESVKKPLANKRSDAGRRLTGNPDNIVQGFEKLYLKIKGDLEADPQTHAVYLLKYAEALSSSGRHSEAREKFFLAFRLWRLNPRLITYGIKLFRR